ncbi:MAG: hypothetical protein JW827_12990 [Spirochaetes bacterium]|nr:hypothetical protein [Spirochaetota bacterium]
MALNETNCPSCGKFVGAYEKCPYCGAHVEKRISIKFFRYGSLVFSFLGLLLLYFISTHKEIPLIKINQISPTMNFAYIRVRGIVFRYPSYDKQLDILTLSLNDGTEDIIVKAYRATAKKLQKMKMIPKLGDLVDVEGTVRIRGAGRFLTINIPEKLKITYVAPRSIRLDEISFSMVNQKVTVTGRVDNIRSYGNYASLFITDEAKKNSIRIPLNYKILGENIPPLEEGFMVKVRGIVSYYSGYYNIVPISAKSIRTISKDTRIVQYNIKDITDELLDQTIKTKGLISKFRRFAKGVSLTLSDQNAFIDTVLWNNVYEVLSSKDLIQEGSFISVTGKIGIYRGKLQITPKNPKNIQIIKTQLVSKDKSEKETIEEEEEKSQVTEIPLTLITNITGADLGKTFHVKGIIIDYYEFSRGRNIILKDNSGQMGVVLWDNVLENIPEAEYLITGAELEVTGILGQYKTNMQLVPNSVEDIKIIKIVESESPMIEDTNVISTNTIITN